MSASATTPATTPNRSALRPDPATTGGAAVALACALVGQYVQTPWRSESAGWGVDFSGGGGFGALALLVGLVVVAAVVVSAVVTAARRTGPDAAARRSLWLAVIGAAALAVFWTGLPPVLAAGAAGLAADSRRRSGRTLPAAVITFVLAALTIAAALQLAVTG